MEQQKNSQNINWEILLVDNASTDNTTQIAAKEWDQVESDVPFSIVNESRPRKGCAIDLGFRLAKYNYVVICDDDNWLDSTYIKKVYEIMNSNQRIGILGGKGIAELESDLPAWFQCLSHILCSG